MTFNYEQPPLGKLAKNAVSHLSANTSDIPLTLTATERTEGGVRIVTLGWTAHTVNLGGVFHEVPAGTIDLNSGHVLAPTTFYIYVSHETGQAIVSASTTSPEDHPLVNYEYSWISIVRMKSVAGTATIYYVRRAYCADDALNHFIGEWDLLKTPLYIDGGGLTINATTGAVSMATLAYQRLRFENEITAITNGVMLLSDETTTHANLETVTTYLDGSPITAGKYHKVLLGAITSLNAAYPFVLIRQGKPGTEYATLDAATIDAERVAANSFPLSYRGMVFPLAYISMKVGDASDLEIIDIRATGIVGSGGGGGGILDHHLLVNTNDPSDHLYAVLIDGTRAFTGNVDMGANQITNVGNVDGVDISAHVVDATAHGNSTVKPSMPYGMYSDSTTQAIANIANAQVITFNTNVYTSGITRTSASRYTIITPGTYLITFSGIANLALTPASKHLEVWLRVDGTDVPNSNTRVELPTVNAETTVAVSFIYKFSAGQYFELWTWGDDTDCRWLATAAATGPTRPAVPSIIMTVNMVSRD